MTTDRRADVLRDLTCPDCGAPVQALLCGTSPTSDEAVAALRVLLVAVHRRLAGCTRKDPSDAERP